MNHNGLVSFHYTRESFPVLYLWCTPNNQDVRQRQEDCHEFQASLGYEVTLKNNQALPIVHK